MAPRNAARKPLTAKQVLTRSIPEATFQQDVIDLCKWHRFLWFHIYHPRTGPAGYPDTHIVGSWSIIRELKTETGVVSPEQRDWLTRLRDAGENVDVWRTRDWISGRVQEELALLRRPKTGEWPWLWLWTP